MNCVQNHRNMGEFLVWDWYIGINEIYEEFSMAVFSNVQSFSKSKFPKHTFMSFPWQFFPRYNLSPNPSFQTPVFGKLARVTVKPFLCSNYKPHYSAPGDLLIVVSNFFYFFSVHKINVHSERNAAIKLQKHHFMGLKGYSVWLQNGQQWKLMKQ